MKQHTYTLIALGIFFGPFLLSFHPLVFFIQYLPAVVISVLVVGGLYIVWDSLAVRWGHWRFNPTYVGEVRWLGLPPGEWLFFLVVPYACLFVYEVSRVLFVVTSVHPSFWWIQGILALGFGVLAWVWRRQGYTSLALGSVGLFWFLSVFLAPGIVSSSTFWFFIGFSMFAFVIVDGLYVNLPTIFYNEKAIWGIKIFNIPLEDFLYNFSLLGLVLLVYLQFR
ncbi:MAG: lycopene cyclase domain-containing protein [Brevinematales bacterium]|nr:lycopene cyclase domain-containing protein [Brevinematales bacterium]